MWRDDNPIDAIGGDRTGVFIMLDPCGPLTPVGADLYALVSTRDSVWPGIWPGLSAVKMLGRERLDKLPDGWRWREWEGLR